MPSPLSLLRSGSNATEKTQPGFFLLITVLTALAWVITAWLLSSQYAKWRSGDLLAAHESQVSRTAETIALGLHRDLMVLHGMPSVRGQSSTLIAALKASNTRPSAATAEARRKQWTENPTLLPLHQRLAEARRSLGAF